VYVPFAIKDNQTAVLRELQGTGFYNTSDGLCHGCLDCDKTGIVRLYKSRIGKNRNSGLIAKGFQADHGLQPHRCQIGDTRLSAVLMYQAGNLAADEMRRHYSLHACHTQRPISSFLV
jgi:hypothetical protein